MSAKSKRKVQKLPKKQATVKEQVKSVLSRLAALEQKLIGFVQAFQRNLNQLFTNQKAIGDMAYTNNVHVHVLRKMLEQKLDVTKEEYEEACNLEMAARDAIRQQQIDAAREAAEKQAAEKAEAALPKAEEQSAEPNNEPTVFGGDVGEDDGKAQGGQQSGSKDGLQQV